MSEPKDGAAPIGAAVPTDADALQADIERTREELGRTVDELAQKFDVKSRAKDKASELKDQAGAQVAAAREQGSKLVSQARDAVTEDDGSTKPAVPVAAAAVAGAAALAAAVRMFRGRNR